jgi:hypothetical protein
MVCPSGDKTYGNQSSFSKNPRSRFCSPRCRVADWHVRNDNRTDETRHGVSNAVPDGEPSTNAVPSAPNDVPSGVLAINGVQRCHTATASWARPDEISQLPWNCHAMASAIVFTDCQANRLHRWLPIPDGTAQLILDQQARVPNRWLRSGIGRS